MRKYIPTQVEHEGRTVNAIEVHEFPTLVLSRESADAGMSNVRIHPRPDYSKDEVQQTCHWLNYREIGYP